MDRWIDGWMDGRCRKLPVGYFFELTRHVLNIKLPRRGRNPRITLAKSSTIIVAAVIAIAAVGAAAYFLSLGGGQPEPSGDGGSADKPNKFVTVKLVETFAEAKEWSPSQIYLKKGDFVELTVINSDDDDIHRLAIPDLGVETKDIPAANQQDVIRFKVDRTGNFTFFDPLAPDPNSPECVAQKEEAEEEEEAGGEVLGELVEDLEEIVEALGNATTMAEATPLITKLNELVEELEANASEEMAEPVQELKATALELKAADDIAEVQELVEELEEPVEELEELAEEEPMCVPPGHIIVE